MSEPQDKQLGPGSVVSGYRIEGRLGQGGAGTVYAAEEPTIKKRVAIKVLRHALAEDEGMVARFEREARAVNEIRHPGIVDVFALGRLDDGRPYLVMSLLEGCSLRDEIRRRGRLPLAEAWPIAREVAEALAAAHAAGVVHRDLKPDNVFLERARGPEGEARPPRVRVLDFGIAKLETEGAEPMKLTATGVPLGTPAYMAPEQWWGSGVSAPTDQYALGAMLFEMLSGRPPFVSNQYAELLQLHVHEPPPALHEVGVTVPEPIEALLARLLAKPPGDRFASMSALIDAGDRALAGLAPDDPPAAVAVATPPPTAPRATAAAAPAPDELVLEAAPPEHHALRSYLSLHAAILVLGAAGVVAVGYGGVERHDPVAWVQMGGFGLWSILLWSLAAALALPSLARRRTTTGEASLVPFWIALCPALQGAFTTYTGWRAIMKAMPDAPALDLFTRFSQGTLEANAGRFLGFSLASLLFLSVAAMPGVSGMAEASTTLDGALGVRPREALGAAAALALVALLAALGGAPSGALIAAVSAVAVASCAALPTLHGETAARDELERAAAGILAVGLAVAAGITRVEAHEASLWAEAETRAARVAGILAAQGERDLTLPIAAVSLAIFAGVEVLRLSRLRPLPVLAPPGAGALLLGGAVALGIAADFVQHGRFADERAALRADLGAQFAIFSRLDPPPGDALDRRAFHPHRATALQITRDVIAVDGRGVARLAALAAPEGTAHVAADLDRALAQATLEQKSTGEVDLSVSIDREVDTGAVLHLLRIARGAGARRIEILLTRGESPQLGGGGPPEIGIVIPDDFVALPAELGDAGFLLPAGHPFGSTTSTLVLQALAAHGPIALAVDAGHH
jgi:serine/threonine-protein kinase